MIKRIGVLALQGAFKEHVAIVRQAGARAIEVRLPEELEGLDGLIIPGGESTSIRKLMVSYDLTSKVKKLAQQGLPIMGTCAGMILLARKVDGLNTQPTGIMDIEIRRNAFGRQVDSFETELVIPLIGNPPYRGIFIRAPKIERTGNNVEVLATLSDNTAVAARENNLLVFSFHPELTTDYRLHDYFLSIVDSAQ